MIDDVAGALLAVWHALGNEAFATVLCRAIAVDALGKGVASGAAGVEQQRKVCVHLMEGCKNVRDFKRRLKGLCSGKKMLP
jgi:hypothetical protein